MNILVAKRIGCLRLETGGDVAATKLCRERWTTPAATQIIRLSREEKNEERDKQISVFKSQHGMASTVPLDILGVFALCLRHVEITMWSQSLFEDV